MRDVPQAVQDTNDLTVRLVNERKFELAIVSARRGLACLPNSAELWCNLGACLWHRRQHDEAMVALRRALEINADYPVALQNTALIHEAMGRPEQAREFFDRAIALDPDYLDARWDRALLQLGTGQYREGFAGYEIRTERSKKDYPEYTIPRWQGDDLSGKSVMIAPEQGIGDMILFSRFLPALGKKAAKIWACFSGPLTSLLWGYRDIVEFLPENVPLPQADYLLFLGSLPQWYGLNGPADVPSDPGVIARRVDQQLKTGKISLPDPGDVPKPNLKIGICWTGNPNQQRNNERSVPLEMLVELASDPRIWLYSLQLGPGAEQLHDKADPELVMDMSPWLPVRGLVGAGTIIRQLDLVITCCTSIAHLAGVVGAPTWVMLCTDPYWPWMYGEKNDNAWYPSTRLFRQRNHGDWRPVIEDIRAALDDILIDKVDHGECVGRYVHGQNHPVEQDAGRRYGSKEHKMGNKLGNG